MFKALKINLIIPALLFAAVGNAQPSKIKRPGEPDIYGVKDNDKEMIAAIEKARTTFKEFELAFSSKQTVYQYFAIKRRFNTPNGGEHIWLTQITKANNEYYGIVNNLPNTTKDIKIGDKIKIDKKNISDWMFIDKGNILYGGYTIRLLRHRMSAKDREEFDEENSWIIND
jgi:uncharacterized protein YegJ (DUF2314 family)